MFIITRNLGMILSPRFDRETGKKSEALTFEPDL